MANFLASNNGFFHSSDFKQLAKAALADPLGAMVILRDGKYGHVVPLLDVRDGGDGSVILDTGNSNLVFLTDPGGPHEAAVDGKAHDDRIGRNQVHIQKNGDFTFIDQVTHAYSSNAFDLFIAPASQFVTVDFPTSTNAGTALGHLIFGSDGAEVRQITDGSGRTMLATDGKPNHDPKTRIPSSGIWPVFGRLPGAPTPPALFILPPNSIYRYDLASTGPYTLRAASPGFGAVVNVGAGNSTGDQANLDTWGALEVHTTAQRTIAADLVVHNLQGKAHRAVNIEGVVPGGGAARIEFTADREQVIYKHTGHAGTIKLTFTTTAKPGARLLSAPVQVGHGDVVTFKPDWSALDRGAGTLQLRKAAGAATTRAIR